MSTWVAGWLSRIQAVLRAAHAGDRARALLAVVCLAVVCLSMLALSCGSRVGTHGGQNLLRGLSPRKAVGVTHAAQLTDGIAAVPGDAWDTNLSVRFDDTDSYVVYDLGATVPIHAIWFQADHNDDYRFLVSEDGDVFEQLWDSPAFRGGGGMQERFTDTLDVTGRYLRVEPVRGDGHYGVSEIQVWSERPSVFPPQPRRQRGLSLEIVARTKLLFFAAAAVAFLFLTFQGAPLSWILLWALFPVVTGAEAIASIVYAWPVEARQVSLVRAVAAAIAAAAVLRDVFAPPRFPALRAAIFSCLGVSALVAVLAFYNLGRPQFWDGQTQSPTPVHLLDLRQYYATAKYFDEIGYRGMYLADVAAYAEDIPGASLESLRDTPMRDLATHRMTTIGAEHDHIEGIKRRFTPERWQAYKRDARYFREMMGQRDYLHYMFDYGGNATPVWISVAHFLFSHFEANTGAFLLTGLLDPLLFLASFAAIGWCFGYRTMCVVMVVFGANDFIMYGSNWGGATLRHDWLMYIGLGACALKRRRPALGGFFLALSSTIRAFPAITLVTAAFPALWWLIDLYRTEHRLPTPREFARAQRPLLRLLGAALLTAVVLVGLTTLRWSPAAWGDWFWKVERLSADPHANSVALRGLVAGWEGFQFQVLSTRLPLYVAAIAFYVIGVFLAARGRPLEQAAILGLILVPVVFYAANYYIHIVCLLPLLALERSEPAPVDTPGVADATADAVPAAALSNQASAGVSSDDAGLWVVLLGLCVAQYWTVLVSDTGLHFHFATVLLFVALTAMVVLLVRGEVREGRLEFLVRFLQEKPGSSRAP